MDVDYYNENRGIASPLIEHNGIIIGVWMCGNNYRNASKLYGAYPPCYLKRMRLLFHKEMCKGGDILHLFSGDVRVYDKNHEATLDIRPESSPDIVANAEEVGTVIVGNSIDLILADPPYSNAHIKYNTPKANKRRVIKGCVKILKVGGYLVWLDDMMPMWAKSDGWRLRGTIGLIQSTNHRCRLITILEKIW